MKVRIYRLNEYLQRIEARLQIEEHRPLPNSLILLYLRSARLRIKNALVRAKGRMINPHRRARAALVANLLRTA